MEVNQDGLFSPVKRIRKDVVRKHNSNEIEDRIMDIPTFETSDFITYDLQLNNYNDGLERMLSFKTYLIPEYYQYLSSYFMYEYMKWPADSYVFINAGTGTGKTTFIEELARLSKYHILILTNRRANREQIQNHLKNSGVFGLGYMVKVISYQELEKNIDLTSDILDLYDYIVCDESHYYLADSDFNSLTNLSLMKIMSTKHAVKIFMSATNEYIQDRITKRLINFYKNDLNVAQKLFIYEMQKSATSIRNIISFDNFEKDLVDKILDSNSKWLIFVKSIAQGREFYSKLQKKLDEQIIFLDRDSADEGTEVQKVTFKKLIEDEIFDQKVLITTCLLDNGVNIRSNELNNIVCFDDDPVEIIQMIGRKRFNEHENDFVDIYLYNESNQSLAVSLLNTISKKKKYISVKKDIEELHELDIIHYLNTKEGTEYRNMSYYNPYMHEYSFNYLGYSKTCKEIEVLNTLRKMENPFDLKVCWILNKYKGSITGKIMLSKDIQKERFIQSVSILIDTSCPYRTKKDQISFHKLISDLFWDEFKKLPGERSDRPLDINKLRERFIGLEIPLDFRLSNEEVQLIRKEVNEYDAK